MSASPRIQRVKTAQFVQREAHRQRQTRRRFVSGVSLNGSAIRRFCTQKILPLAASATTKSCRRERGIFWFVNKSWSFTADFRPMG